MSSRRDYRCAKKRLYLEPPRNRVETIRRSLTRIIPAPEPSPPPCPPPVIVEPPPPCLPPPPPSEPDTIDVIAVDVEPSEKSRSRSRRSHSRSRSRSHSRVCREVQREVYIERERLVPVPFPVRVHQPEYETYRYVEGPRRCSPPPPPPSPPRRSSCESDRKRISVVIEDRHRERDYYRR